MLQRFKENIDSGNHYSRVYIYGSINDIFGGKSPDIAISNIQKMVNLALQNKIDPIIVLGYDPKILMDTISYTHKSYIKEYSNLQKRIKSEVFGAYIIDVCPLEKSDSYDGVHLNEIGTEKFYKWIYLHDKKI